LCAKLRKRLFPGVLGQNFSDANNVAQSSDLPRTAQLSQCRPQFRKRPTSCRLWIGS
jgi:hypothetical protein